MRGLVSLGWLESQRNVDAWRNLFSTETRSRNRVSLPQKVYHNMAIRMILLSMISMASAAVLPRALPLELVTDLTIPTRSSVSTLAPPAFGESSSNLSLPLSFTPDSRFTARISIGSTLMPIDSFLVNILNFMGIVATQDFERKLSPRKYTTPGYREVEVTTFDSTETRFLLWGIYMAVTEMVRIVRFNEVRLELNWDDQIVGRVKVALRQRPGAGLAQTNSTDTNPVPVIGNVTDEDSVSATGSSINGTSLSIRPGFHVTYDSLADAGKVNRNDVFLTFYNAIGHVAQFPAQDQMGSFNCFSPNAGLHLTMQDVMIGCTVSRAKDRLALERSAPFYIQPRWTEKNMLTFRRRIQCEEAIAAFMTVPEYMMEHNIRGYMETHFLLKLKHSTLAIGTLLKHPRPVERRSLEE